MARAGTARALEILQEVAAEREINRAAIMGPARTKDISSARREFCVRAVGEGIGIGTVADILACDHTTVVYHTSPRIQERKREMRAYKAAKAAAANA